MASGNSIFYQLKGDSATAALKIDHEEEDQNLSGGAARLRLEYRVAFCSKSTWGFPKLGVLFLGSPE